MVLYFVKRFRGPWREGLACNPSNEKAKKQEGPQFQANLNDMAILKTGRSQRNLGQVSLSPCGSYQHFSPHSLP